MGEPSSDIRSSETTNMLNYAFNSFKLNTIIDNNEELAKTFVAKSKNKTATIVVKNSITELISKDKEAPKYNYNLKLDNIKAPVKKGDKVGTVEIMDNEGLIVREEEVTVSEDIEKASLGQVIIENFLMIIRGKDTKRV